ncbi:MAG: hypothetical protein V1646_01635 [bacterium]
MKKNFCKKLFYLLILTLLQASLADINLYAGDELHTGTPTNFSFEDFLKQLETQDPDKNLDSSTTQDQDKDLVKTDTKLPITTKKSTSFEQSPFLFDLPTRTKADNQGKKLEQEIINILNQKITPLANDLSKVVKGPESKKALAEKKKQREQEEKEAARRIEQMKSKRPSGYSPSYRPSSGYGNRDWSPTKGRSGGYGGYGSGGYGGYSGYSPSSSYWDKYKGDGALKNQDQDKTITTGKEEKKKKGGFSGREGNKDIKRSIAYVDNLTNRIQAILSRENGKIGNKAAIQDLATGATLVELKNLFDTRQQELIKIPEKQKDVADEKSGRTASDSRKTYKSHEYKIKNLEQEKGMWEKFAPQIVSAINLKSGDEGKTEAQNAGRALLSSLKLYRYISESAGKISDEVEQKYGKGEPKANEKADKKKSKADAILNQIKNYTEIIENFITQNTKDLKQKSTVKAEIDKNNAIYKKLVTKGFFTQVLELLEKRESKLMKLDNPKEIKEKEKELWDKFLPTLIQAVTYSEKEEDPMNAEIQEMHKQQAQGKTLMEKLCLNGYVSNDVLKQKQTDFEKLLKKEIKPGGGTPDLEPASEAGKIMINRVKKLKELFGNIQDSVVDGYK